MQTFCLFTVNEKESGSVPLSLCTGSCPSWGRRDSQSESADTYLTHSGFHVIVIVCARIYCRIILSIGDFYDTFYDVRLVLDAAGKCFLDIVKLEVVCDDAFDINLSAGYGFNR